MKKQSHFLKFTTWLCLLLAALMLASCASDIKTEVPSSDNETHHETPAGTDTEAPAPHVHHYEAEFVEPTLTAQGYTLEKCACGDTRIVAYTGLTGEKEGENAVEHTILFIGNSYTYYNNGVDALFEMIANGQGYYPTVKAITHSAYKLSQFADPNDADGKKVLAELTGDTPYDVVFLQEQTTLPASSPASFYHNVRVLDQMIRAKGAVAVLYQTWGRKTGSSTLTDNGWTNETMTYKVAASYEAIADEIGAVLSPAGSAFFDVYTNHPEIELYNADLSHPSLAGSYLAALCHYAAVYGKSPVGVTFIPKGISAEHAAILQAAAHKAVFGGSIVPEEYKTSSVGVGG